MLQEIYRTDADPGLHAASEWLLRKWGEEEWLMETNSMLAADEAERVARLDKLLQMLAADTELSPQWYTDSQRQTMVVIPGPVEFQMGARPDAEIRPVGGCAAPAKNRANVCHRLQTVDTRAIPSIRSRLFRSSRIRSSA